jgi:hypothetical protein
MTALELLNLLTEHLKKHRKDAAESIVLNKHLTDWWNKLPQNNIDAVVVDFINSLAVQKYGIDYALSVDDLQDKEDE